MFTAADYLLFDPNYFVIIETRPQIIVVQSKSTRHMWCLQSSGDQYNTVRLSHKHKRSDTWHGQSFYGVKPHNTKGALQAIQNHDTYFLANKLKK